LAHGEHTWASRLTSPPPLPRTARSGHRRPTISEERAQQDLCFPVVSTCELLRLIPYKPFAALTLGRHKRPLHETGVQPQRERYGFFCDPKNPSFTCDPRATPSRWIRGGFRFSCPNLAVCARAQRCLGLRPNFELTLIGIRLVARTSRSLCFWSALRVKSHARKLFNRDFRRVGESQGVDESFYSPILDPRVNRLSANTA